MTHVNLYHATNFFINSRFDVHFFYPKMKISSFMLVLSKQLF